MNKIEKIMAIVSKETGVSIENIKGTSRKTPIVFARHLSLWACRWNAGTSQKAIAATHNLAQHGTVIHASNSIESQMKCYPNVVEICNKIENLIN